MHAHDHKANHRIRIVVADDFPAMLDTVEKCLAPGCEIMERASDGLALVESVCRLRPDLLITDISMPNLNGIEALRQLRNLGVQTPAIILTLINDKSVAQQAFIAGAQAFVLKCRLESDLRMAVQEALAGRMYTSEPVSNSGVGEASR